MPSESTACRLGARFLAAVLAVGCSAEPREDTVAGVDTSEDPSAVDTAPEPDTDDDTIFDSGLGSGEADARSVEPGFEALIDTWWVEFDEVDEYRTAGWTLRGLNAARDTLIVAGQRSLYVEPDTFVAADVDDDADQFYVTIEHWTGFDCRHTCDDTGVCGLHEWQSNG
ncbi:MAG: hypothetical protein Q8P41_31135 [Pseudomonadota bacterium]|nr:hypothetical protein [Pseudomonadota bacterium]